MALMVLGAVRLRTWARPERATGGTRPGPDGQGAAQWGSSRRGREARMVVGQVRFLTRARRESAQGSVCQCEARYGRARRGVTWQGMEGSSDGRRQGSTPCPSTARKGYWRGEVWSGEASRVGARPGEASRGKSWGALLADTGVQVPGAHGPQGLKECSGREWKGFSWNSRVWPRTWRKPRR